MIQLNFDCFVKNTRISVITTNEKVEIKDYGRLLAKPKVIKYFNLSNSDREANDEIPNDTRNDLPTFEGGEETIKHFGFENENLRNKEAVIQTNECFSQRFWYRCQKCTIL
jgi:hypothetical protein